jgi:Alpha and gamma adaptin binding protein p34
MSDPLIHQPYADHVFALHNGIARFEPEVALAISLGNEPAHPTDPPEGPDPFLADHGFEYIDGERTRHPTSNADAEDDDEDVDIVQGLPRVVDALSTIMWPSMIRDPDGGKKRKSQRQSPSTFDFDVLRMGTAEEEDTLAALMVADAADHGVPLTRASRVQKEMAALERWLIENEELHESEIRGATTSPDGIDDEDGDVDDEGELDEELDEDGDSDGPSSVPVLDSIPMPVPSRDPWASSNNNNNNKSMPPSTAPSASGDDTTVRPSGFDDDFTAFVSAPVPAPTAPTSTTTTTSRSGSAGGRVTHAHAFLDVSTTMLLPSSHTGSSSRFVTPLAFDDDDDDAADGHLGYEALDDDHGSSFEFDFSPGQHEHDHLTDERTSMSMGGGGGEHRVSGEHRAGREGGVNDDDEVPFDLTNILSELQTVRENVAGIGDEARRKEMTARFASEFVFKRMRMGMDDGDVDDVDDER